MRNLFNAIGELRGRVDSICTEFQTQIEELKAENTTLKTALDDVQDSLVRQSRQNQIIIRNVPVLQNENLVDLFGKLSKAIKFNLCSTYNIYRQQPKDINKQLDGRRTRSQTVNSVPSVATPPPIIFKHFQNNLDKSNFLRCYLNIGNVNLEALGFASPGRIYFGENLTKRNYTIFRKCSQMKKRKLNCKTSHT